MNIPFLHAHRLHHPRGQCNTQHCNTGSSPTGHLLCEVWRMPLPHSFIRMVHRYCVCVRAREPHSAEFSCVSAFFGFCMPVARATQTFSACFCCANACITPSSYLSARLVTHDACRGMKILAVEQNGKHNQQRRTHIDGVDEPLRYPNERQRMCIEKTAEFGVHRSVAIDVTFSTLRQLIAIGARSFFALVFLNRS